ncbi:MAG: RsiV family protein [bacterium]
MKIYLFTVILGLVWTASPMVIYSEQYSDSAIYNIEVYQDFIIQTEDQIISSDSFHADSNIYLSRITDTVVYVRFELLNITEAPNLGISGDIDKLVAKAVFSDSTSFDDYFENFVQQYNETMEQNPEMRSQSGWFDQRTLTVSYNANYLLSLGIHFFSFLGGAHPSHGTRYLNFNLESGDSLILQNIFNAEGFAELNELGEKKFRELHSIPPDTNINDFGFWFDQDSFYLNHNFYFDSAGMHFLYNPYEIACYAAGYTQLDFSWEELKGLTDSGSIIYSIINKIIEP